MTTFVPEQSVVEDWVRCPSCRELVYLRRYERELRVCQGCGAHDRLTAPQRLAHLFDAGSVTRLDVRRVPEDPLDFVADNGYRDSLARARARTGLEDAVVPARATLAGRPVVTAVMDFRFFGGSMGTAAGEALRTAMRVAVEDRLPLILVTSSGGARMQEGALSLMQMVKTSQEMAILDEAGVLTITVATDPTYGGVAASFAALADVIIAEPGAHVGFAGARVIEQTIRQRLPEGFQTAEFLLEHGLVDAVVPRAGLRDVLARLIAVTDPPVPHSPSRPAQVITDPDQLPAADAWQTVGLARHSGRPTTLDYVERMLDDFCELSGDRCGTDSKAIVAGLGILDGIGVAVIGHEKGHRTAERTRRNFGMAGPGGYRKAARVMRLAAKLGLPVVTLIDTPGADPGIAAEEQGQAIAIAENLRLMSTLPVPVVAVVIGEGGSGGALALGVADRVLALRNAVYSVISPEGCAAILWKDSASAPLAADALGLAPRNLLRHKVIDAVVDEPAGGAHTDPAAAAEALRAAIVANVAELSGHTGAELVARRRARFAAFGLGPGHAESRR